jgi:hypothetical protein
MSTYTRNGDGRMVRKSTDASAQYCPPTMRQSYKMAYLSASLPAIHTEATLANLAGQYADAMLAEDERHASKSNSTQDSQ